MQSQMRALWADQPQVNAALEVLEAEPVEDTEPVLEEENPAQRQGGPVGAHASDDEEE